MNALTPGRHAEIFSVVSAAEIARRHTRSGIDWITLVWTAFGLSAIALSSWGAWTERTPLWLSFLANAYFMFFVFATMHEASHGNIARGRFGWLNPALGWFCGFVNLVPYRGWSDLHAWHHARVNDVDGDPDEWVKGSNPFAVIFRAATIPPHYVHFYLRTRAYDKVRNGRFAFAFILLTWIVPLSLGSALWATSGDYRLLVLWPLAAYLSIFFMGMMFVWFPHFPKAGKGRTDNSITWEFSGPAGTIMRVFDFWQSYHLIHHAYPRVPFYRQGRLFRDLRDRIEADGSEIIDV